MQSTQSGGESVLQMAISPCCKWIYKTYSIMYPFYNDLFQDFLAIALSNRVKQFRRAINKCNPTPIPKPIPKPLYPVPPPFKLQIQ